MKAAFNPSASGQGGFTLVEVLIAATLSLLVVGGAFGVYVGTLRYWHRIDCRVEADRSANGAVNRMVYGVGDRPGLRAAASVAMQDDDEGWTLTYTTASEPPQTNSFTYSEASSNLTFNPGAYVVGDDISLAVVAVEGRMLSVTVRVDRVDGDTHARREIGTQVYWRN